MEPILSMSDRELFDYLAKEGLTSWQLREEICWAVSTMRESFGETLPKVVLEIGSKFGGTLIMLSRLLSPDGVAISIDPSSHFKVKRVQEYLPSVELFHLKGLSSDTLVVREIDFLLSRIERKIDILFIDADHSYDASKSDYEIYSKLMSPFGVVAFHDIGSRKYGCAAFWDEIRKDRPHDVKVAARTYDVEKPLAGIGILYL